MIIHSVPRDKRFEHRLKYELAFIIKKYSIKDGNTCLKNYADISEMFEHKKLLRHNALILNTYFNTECVYELDCLQSVSRSTAIIKRYMQVNIRITHSWQ